MRATMEVALSEVGKDMRWRVRSTATMGGASADVVGRAQGNGAPVDPNRVNANQWADKVKSRVQFWHDPDVEAEKWWAEHGQRTIDVLAQYEVGF